MLPTLLDGLQETQGTDCDRVCVFVLLLLFLVYFKFAFWLLYLFFFVSMNNFIISLSLIEMKSQHVPNKQVEKH